MHWSLLGEAFPINVETAICLGINIALLAVRLKLLHSMSRPIHCSFPVGGWRDLIVKRLRSDLLNMMVNLDELPWNLLYVVSFMSGLWMVVKENRTVVKHPLGSNRFASEPHSTPAKYLTSVCGDNIRSRAVKQQWRMP